MEASELPSGGAVALLPGMGLSRGWEGGNVSDFLAELVFIKPRFRS
jgi:hypothetical protein